MSTRFVLHPRRFVWVLSLLLPLQSCAEGGREGNVTPNFLQIDVDDVAHPVSEMLFGLFLEDINFAVDGGLNANMVNNYSFDGVFLQKGGTWTAVKSFLFKSRLRPVYDRLRYWQLSGDGRLESLHDRPLSPNSHYARLTVQGACRLNNLGYNGGRDWKDRGAMGIFEDAVYDFDGYFRAADFRGTVTVYVADDDGRVITDKQQLTKFEHEWVRRDSTLRGKRTTTGRLVLEFAGTGTLDVDAVRFASQDSWGKGDPKWSQGRLRRDLVESLGALRPAFIRFPGGCIVEGAIPGNHYQWKNTVGPLIDRIPDFNLWGALIQDGGYCQSNQIGFYEYFLLCEDLQAEPVPVVWAGLNCQFRSKERIKKDEPGFVEDVVNNAIDLVEYANGDPATNRWAALRAAAGHPKSFNLKYIGIGNENFGTDYLESFEAVKAAIDRQYPGIVCILSTGATLDSDDYQLAWQAARREFPDVRMDEHFYNKPDWLLAHANRYDTYPRGGPKVFLGEYAANRPFFLGTTPNSYRTALAEAAFLTGLERNSDMVVMTAYAPLLSLSEGEQWNHNLINFNPHHVLRTANYFVQELCSTHIGSVVIRIEGDLPAGCYASATADDGHFYIHVVNSTDGERRVTIRLANSDANSATAISLQSDDLEAKNRLPFSGEPEYRIRPKRKEVPIREQTLDLSLEKYSFSVLVINRH